VERLELKNNEVVERYSCTRRTVSIKELSLPFYFKITILLNNKDP
jgi:hypothetical protein